MSFPQAISMILKEIKKLDSLMRASIYSLQLRCEALLANNTGKTLSVRPGRKKVTTSFVCDPQVYNELVSRCPKYGDKSYVIEELIKQFLSGLIQVPARTF